MVAEPISVQNQQLDIRIERIKGTPFLRRAILPHQLREDFDQQIFSRFFPLTRHFALSGMAYVAKICDKIEKSSGNKCSELEDFLCKILSISAGEFSGIEAKGNDMVLTGFKRESIHYNMFREAFCNIGQDDAVRLQSGMSTATKELIYLIRRNFADDNIVYGFVNYFVIETCAPAMVSALVYYLTPKLEARGCGCDYLTLHEEIEKHHASHVDSLLTRHFSDPEDKRFFAAAKNQLCEAMERFWNDISNSVQEGREDHF